VVRPRVLFSSGGGPDDEFQLNSVYGHIRGPSIPHLRLFERQPASEAFARPKEMGIEMRTTKRFTPGVLERFRRVGRGQGTGQEYIPWHRVGRSDPASQGRSHLLRWNGRHLELLSDKERAMAYFSIMQMSSIRDIREQFPLALDASSHELASYRADVGLQRYPGTRDIAAKLQIKMPKVSGDGVSADWVSSTDLLLTLVNQTNQFELLAVAFKPASETLSKRKRQLLHLEKSYWDARCVPWLLITSREFDHRVADTLCRTMPWVLAESVSNDQIESARVHFDAYRGCSLHAILQKLTSALGSLDLAQRAFWQAVWKGKIPIDLRMGWRPHLPIICLSHDEFVAFNPIASRRTAWI
jgi:hypothetical protein